MTEQQPGKRPPIWRRRYLVLGFQKKYAIGLTLLLFTYCLIPFGIAFVVPYIGPSIKLFSTVPPEEQAQAASQILALGQVALPALLVLVAGAAIFSVYVTHRIAGPLYRLRESLKEVAQGNLGLRIRFRKTDELHDIADSMNEAVDKVEQALKEVRSRGATAREALDRALVDMKAQSPTTQAPLSELELALKEVQHIEETLKRFQFSEQG